jgi:hypothetical protein
MYLLFTDFILNLDIFLPINAYFCTIKYGQVNNQWIIIWYIYV